LAGVRAHEGAQEESKNRPVSKVITLLKDMVDQLQKESEEDEDVYEAMGCWCETNDKEKTQAIAAAEQHIADLTASIEELTATSSRLNTEVANLQKEVAKNEGALDQATALRKKQLAEFNEEEKDMIQSITSLKSAVVTLSKHQESLLQDGDDSVAEVAVELESMLRRHKELLGEVISPEQRRAVKRLTTAEAPKALLQDGNAATAPSSEIFGVLKQMKESFETNLAQSQKEESQNQQAFEDLKAAKEAEISAGTSQVDTKTGELAAADEKCAVDKEDLEDTQDTLAADTAFLADLKSRCASVDQEYEERTKTRQLEIQAVSKALEFLSSDDAHDLFSRTLSFVQVTNEASKVRNEAARAISLAAKRFSDPRLELLAQKVRMNAFTKVKENVQKMVDALIQEKEDEIKHRDFCIDELNTNEKDTASKNRDKSDLDAKIEDLQMTIDEATRSLETLKAEIAEMQVQMKRAGEDREKANKDFQMTVADQRASQKLLSAALDVLKGFYEKAALVQGKAGRAAAAAQHKGEQAPPPGFKTYEKSGASGGVMGIIQQIIDDAKAMEADAIRAEGEEQKSYEGFVRDTNLAIEEKGKELTAKGEVKAKTEASKVEEEVHRDSVLGELEQLAQQSADLHRSCDFLLKNFGVRSTARDEEIEALKQGIAMFSGASFTAFLNRE